MSNWLIINETMSRFLRQAAAIFCYYWNEFISSRLSSVFPSRRRIVSWQSIILFWFQTLLAIVMTDCDCSNMDYSWSHTLKNFQFISELTYLCFLYNWSMRRASNFLFCKFTAISWILMPQLSPFYGVCANISKCCCHSKYGRSQG